MNKLILNNDELRVEAKDSSIGFNCSSGSLSCTGPVVGYIEFPRFILHKLDIGPETVIIELAEAVE